MTAIAGDRAIRIQEVCMRTGMGRTWLYGEITAGRFPQPFKPGARTNLWLESEVTDWIYDRAAQRRSDDQPPAKA